MSFKCRQPTSETCLKWTERSQLLRPRQKRQLRFLPVLSAHLLWKKPSTVLEVQLPWDGRGGEATGRGHRRPLLGSAGLQVPPAGPHLWGNSLRVVPASSQRRHPRFWTFSVHVPGIVGQSGNILTVSFLNVWPTESMSIIKWLGCLWLNLCCLLCSNSKGNGCTG